MKITLTPKQRTLSIVVGIIFVPMIIVNGITMYQKRTLSNELLALQDLSVFSNWDGDFRPAIEGNVFCLDTCTNGYTSFFAKSSSTSDELSASLTADLQRAGYTIVSTPKAYVFNGYAGDDRLILTANKGKINLELQVRILGGYSTATLKY